VTDRRVLNLDEIMEPEDVVILEGMEYKLRSMNMGDQLKFGVLWDASQKAKSEGDYASQTRIMQELTLISIPDMTPEQFGSLRGRKLDALMKFLGDRARAIQADDGSNPTGR